MKRSIVITQDEYNEALAKYTAMVSSLSPQLQAGCPHFEKFLSPANWTYFNRDDIYLSLTGTQRLQILDSPHAVGLLALYAAQRIEPI